MILNMETAGVELLSLRNEFRRLSYLNFLAQHSYLFSSLIKSFIWSTTLSINTFKTVHYYFFLHFGCFSHLFALILLGSTYALAIHEAQKQVFTTEMKILKKSSYYSTVRECGRRTMVP